MHGIFRLIPLLMKHPSTLTSALRRIWPCIAILLLGGCASSSRPVVEVTSPPAPRFGSGPIAAYDAYARAMFFPATGKESATLVSTVGRPSVKTQLMVGEKRPADVAQPTLD